MNREYNDNKMYNSALDELRFSEEAKSRMVDRLMTAAEQPEQPVTIHRVRRFPRIAMVGVAAGASIVRITVFVRSGGQGAAMRVQSITALTCPRRSASSSPNGSSTQSPTLSGKPPVMYAYGRCVP